MLPVMSAHRPPAIITSESNQSRVRFMGMKYSFRVLIRRIRVGSLALALLQLAVLPSIRAGEPSGFTKIARPLLDRYCYGCHGDEKQKADLNLQAYGPDHAIYTERDLWETLRDLVLEREMPPEDQPQPSEEDRIRLAEFINKELARFDCDEIEQPGRVTIRRLNRAEYNHTIRDLMGVDFEPAADFPLDEVGYGFDNIGDVLSLSPILMEKYLTAAEQIAQKAIVGQVPPWPPRTTFEAETFRSRTEDHVRAEGSVMGFYREGTATHLFRTGEAGDYLIKIRAYGQQAGPDPAQLSVRINRKEAQLVEVSAVATKPGTYTLNLTLPASSHRLELGFTNNYNRQDHPISELNGDRNLFVDSVTLEGPLDQPRPRLPGSHTRLIPQPPEPGEEITAASAILTSLVTRAFRRPADPDEIDRLLNLVEYALQEGVTFEESLQVAVQAVLVSPSFLFRWELDGQPGSEGASTRRLTDYEMASRLSYFLWSSMPDDELLYLAGNGMLMDPSVLRVQVRRMLGDSKARALVTHFAGQWLQFRNLDTITPDPDLFPGFTEALRESMRRESELFFGAIMKEDRSVLEFLDADFTFVDRRLADHYGMEGSYTEVFQRVTLNRDSPRGGVLTQASTLALTANPTRTSPVIRGKWVLEQILGTPPPPPPPNVEELEESQEAAASASLRERLELHRSKSECATCHAKMDPIGFAFENFDAIGAWRELDGNFPIDPSGILPDGRSFAGPKELIGILKTETTFLQTITEKMLTFALGRGLEYYDRCATDDIVASLIAGDFRFSALVEAIVLSSPFQMVSLQQEE